MILITLTINSTDYQVSTHNIALETFWAGKVAKVAKISYRLPHIWGGYAEPRFGKLVLAPDLFADEWPPPASIVVKIEYTETTEAAAVVLFNGVGHISEVSRTEISYQVHGPEYDDVVTAQTFTSTDLLAIFTTYCGVTHLDLTLDHTYDRGTSPQVDYTTSTDTQSLKLLSDLAAFFSHCFYIDSATDTLHLIDMQVAAGTSTLTEFDFMPAAFTMNQPVSMFLADPADVAGSYPYGKELTISPVCHGTEGNQNIALGIIRNIYNRLRCVVKKPLDTTSSIPNIGEQITWTDASQYVSTDVTFYVREKTFDLDEEQVILTGDCTVVSTP
jgi:hypothetical protein